MKNSTSCKLPFLSHVFHSLTMKLFHFLLLSVHSYLFLSVYSSECSFSILSASQNIICMRITLFWLNWKFSYFSCVFNFLLVLVVLWVFPSTLIFCCILHALPLPVKFFLWMAAAVTCPLSHCLVTHTAYSLLFKSKLNCIINRTFPSKITFPKLSFSVFQVLGLKNFFGQNLSGILNVILSS